MPIKKTGKTGDLYDKTIEVCRGDLSCTIIIYRKDRDKPFKKTIFFEEFTQDNAIWNSKPRFMLEKVALSIGFRQCFPDEMGGMPYTDIELPDEMTTARDVTPETQKKQYERPQAKKIEPVKENIETLYNEFLALVDQIGNNLLPKDGSNIQRMCVEYKSGLLKSEFLINVTHYLKQHYAEILQQGA